MISISRIRDIRTGNFRGWEIPSSIGPNKAYNALKKGGFSPIMRKLQKTTGERYALLGVRIRVAPWERGILESILKEADRIVRKALGC
jgi:hypothetical protein